MASCDPPLPSTQHGPHVAAPPPALVLPAPPPTPGVHFIRAPATGNVPVLVAHARADAESHRRRLLVYVGATWCEPCQYFHRAAEAHTLDNVFPDLTLLEFDLDHDSARLQAAGYTSQMIPLFAVPGPDGRASAVHIEGSIHGPGSVDQITPRLRALLGS